MRRYLLLLIPLLVAAPLALGQDVVTAEHATFIGTAGYFVVAALAGLVLALAFQLVLTTLSLATGLQVMGASWEDAYAGTGTYDDTYAGEMREGETAEAGGAMGRATEKIAGKARTFSSAFGVWSIITASLALFFASWLATELSLASDLLAGAVLGLVIWGLFYIVLMRYEMSALGSLVGTLNRLAHSGLRTAQRATRAAVRGTRGAAHSDLASNITSRVREEIFGDVDTERFREQLRGYVRECPPPPQLDPEVLRRDLRLMFHDPHAGMDALIRRLRSIDRDTMREMLSCRPEVSAQDAERILNQMEEARDEAIARATRMREEVARRVDTAKREAIHVADEVRKTAAMASWWAFGTAVVSGAAAALGGMVAVITGPWGG